MPGTTTNDQPTGRSYAGFFSSASTFSLPLGSQFTPGSVSGYYIDLRTKADVPSWKDAVVADPADRIHVAAFQWGLGAYERHLAGEGDEWLAAAVACGEEMLGFQATDGPLIGGFVHSDKFWHTFRLDPPWLSSMAQGEGASLFVRLHQATGDARFADAAKRALLPLDLDVAAGGVRAQLGGRPFPEEYPTTPASHVLNGAIFTLWGVHDVAGGRGDEQARASFEQLVDTLAANLHRWDLGYWSRYDLYPHPVVNVASSFYHDLHVSQLRALDRLSPRPQLSETAERWARNAGERSAVARSFARKALFRVLVPRNPAIARYLPWSPFS